MIEIFDNEIPMSIRQNAYTFICNSKYNITGWQDRHDLELSNKFDLHSPWSKEDLKNSGLEPFVNKILKKSKHYNNYTIDDFLQCTINAVRPGDYFYIHTHDPGRVSFLYYCNMHWDNSWAGETIIYNEDLKDIKLCSPYTPGRVLLFEEEPHTIRSQSFNGPQWRFTMALFLQKKETNGQS